MKVSIAFCAVQQMDAEREETRFHADGTLEQTADGAQLRYVEPADAGGAAVELHIHGDRAVIKRRAEVSAELIVEPNKRRMCRYQTPYGQLVLHTVGRYCRFTFDNHTGTVALGYALEMNDALTEQTIEIEIKEVSLC